MPLVFLLIAIASSGLGGCREEPPPDAPRNVLFVLIDTLRADRLGSYGNERGLTPFLDELAAKGVVFSNTFAPSSWTVPSVASLFTSHYPSQHKVTTFDSKVPEEAVTLAETLSSHGFLTAGFTANFRLTKELGYAQGFDEWRRYTGRTGIKVRGDRLRQESEGWLDRQSGLQRAKRQFLYLHFMEPHAPYQPIQPYRSRYFDPVDGVNEAAANDKVGRINFAAVTPNEIKLLRSLYDGEVASVDAELRELFGVLEGQGLLRDALVVLTADHGEEFKEHGRLAHGHALYDESIRVPLIILAPGLKAGVVGENVSLVDVAPTVLELLKLPPEPAFEGRSLVDLMRESSVASWLTLNGDSTRDVLSELPPTGSRFDIRAHSQAIVRDSLKLLSALKGRPKKTVPEIYDLEADPGERKPNPPGLASERKKLETALNELTRSLVQRASLEREKATIDEATKEKLRALGYTF